MDSNLESLRALLKEFGSELMKKQNVVATGIGYKTVGGRRTSDLAIICSVEVKMPEARLSKIDLIPASIQGVPIDVNPTGPIRAFQAPTGRFRPAPGGVSIGHFRITAGTLGCLVKRDDVIYILSNNHVLANMNVAIPGDVILQPGLYDGGQSPADQIAVLSEFVPISFEDSAESLETGTADRMSRAFNSMASIVGSPSRLRPVSVQQAENKVDCAIAKPVKPEDVINEILGIGTIKGTREGELGMAVKKSGRTTGFTSGAIEQIDVSVRVNYGTNRVALFVDQLLAGSMSEGGDSGSAVLSEDNNLVGLLFAGSTSTTIINRISNVFEALRVTLP